MAKIEQAIKYRGKRKDTGEWIYGYYAEPFITNILNKIRKLHVIYVPHKEGFTEELIVIPETVGQFTLLSDKNKKPIYGSIYIEGKMSKGGDIISNGTGRLCEVKWHKWTGEWDAVPFTKNKGSANWFQCQSWGTHIEVIDNAYEYLLKNPKPSEINPQ